ncbi:Phosphoribosylglycinamide formyltransferase [compost metagenome]
MNAIGQAYDYGVKVTGATVHFVDGGMDTGAVIAQRTVDIREGESMESVEERIHAVEKEIYPQVVRLLADGRVKLDGRKVILT